MCDYCDTNIAITLILLELMYPGTNAHIASATDVAHVWVLLT